MLPGKQEAEKVARRDRLDFGAQPPNRIMMDAREQAAVAPLLVVDAGEEASLENGAVAFERCERRCDRARLKPERRGKRRRRDRSQTLEPAPQDLDQSLFLRRRRCGLIGGRRDLRLEPTFRPDGLELRQPLGRNP